jgi:WD40 repeat protein
LLVDSAKQVAYYPLGSSVVVWPLGGNGGEKRSFLTGHTYRIGSIAISKSGKFVATGETHLVGTKVIKTKLITTAKIIELKYGLL